MTHTFMPPSVEVHMVTGRDQAERAIARIAAPTNVGQTLWRTDGVWHLQRSPSMSQLNAAEYVFLGGHEYEVSDELYAEIQEFLA